MTSQDFHQTSLIEHSNTHIPVMLGEVLEALFPALLKNGSNLASTERRKLFVDGTLGGGGHSREIIKKLTPKDQWIGVDQDTAILKRTTQQLEDWALNTFQQPLNSKGHTLQANFSELKHVLQNRTDKQQSPITGGLLLDLGVSSFQLDTGERGFSFRKEAPLDMRMSIHNKLTATEVIASYSEADLIRIFSDYGEERMSKTLAKEIVAHRKHTSIQTTTQLAELIKQTYDRILKRKHYRIHPATCVFQALRIEVNQELTHLETLLDSLPQLLAPQARAAIISFHSLEDRIVKHRFRTLKKEYGFNILTKKPMLPTEEEIKRNPRSRSAKLRIIEAT